MIRYITDEGEILESADYILREISVEPFYEVYSFYTNKPLKWRLNKEGGYVTLGLRFNGKDGNRLLHRLILSTFEPTGYFPGAEANHIDENKLNCKLSNLNWLSREANINHKTHNQRVSESLINRKDQSKPVLQFTKEGIFVAEYSSTWEAYRQTGIAHSSISKCCNGKLKSTGGFIWKYK